MPNGKPGDHPITDILIHHRPVFSPAIDALIAEIVRLGGRDELEQTINLLDPPPDDQLRSVLENLRDQVKDAQK